MSDKEKFDLLVIGAGSGGVRAARIAAGHGARVAICEESRVGGTCVIRGCVPKKLLVYGAHFAADFEDAKAYGWSFGDLRFDWNKLIANKDKEIDRLNGIYHQLLDNAGVTTIMGRGEFIDAHSVRIGEQVVQADRILVATGGRPFVPDFPGSELTITSDEAFHLSSLPRHVVIVGGGYIAVEFAGIFNALGARVDLVYRRDLILRGFDDDLRRSLEHELQQQDIQIMHHCNVARIDRDGQRLRVCYDNGEQALVDQVMVATGRKPHTRGLGLERAGVETDAAGAICVDAWSRSSVPHVFAVGDVTNRVNLTPVAIREGHAFADTEFGGQPRCADHDLVPAAVFSQPPIGTVGLTQAQAQEKFGRIRVYKSSFRALKHTLTPRQEKTYMKLIVNDQDDKVVGLHVLGMDAPEIVQGFAVAVKAGLTKQQFDATVGIHPTAGEELVTMRDHELIGQ